MRRDFSRSWHSIGAWNERMEERGYDAAKLTEKPWRSRLKLALVATLIGVRERWACRLAPWVIDASQYDQIVGR